MLLESKSKFNWKERPNTTASTMRTSVTPQDFARWSASNLYRTSYNDMSAKVSHSTHRISINLCIWHGFSYDRETERKIKTYLIIIGTSSK